MNNITVFQWNARGLSKSRLEEFKKFLSLYNPSLCLLCETFWKYNSKIKFKNYRTVHVSRPDRPGGGVAILIANHIPFTNLILPQFMSIEAVGVTITSSNLGQINVISAYCPKGDCSTEEIRSLFNTPSEYIIAGDFNGHHNLWSKNVRENRSGKSIYNALLDSPDTNLLTPYGLATYINPGSGKESTLDLTFMTSSIALDSTVHPGPYLGSDHIPLIIESSLTAHSAYSHIPRWIFHDDKWSAWNSEISRILVDNGFLDILDPLEKYSLFRDAILDASKLCFSITKPESHKKQEPARPWWNEDVKRKVALARKAFKQWRLDPCSDSKRAAWSVAEAIKRKTILRARRDSWAIFVSNLNPQNGRKLMWAFIKAMNGRGWSSPVAQNIRINQHSVTNDPKIMAETFLNSFFGEDDHAPAKDPTIDDSIKQAINSPIFSPLNSPITLDELDTGLRNLKSNATGKDGIHNRMLQNLNKANCIQLLHLFNSLLHNGVVPQDWKEAVVIPLLKADKNPEDPKSYRPISLTSCLGKAMEKIITKRLNWHLENYNYLQPSQAGFRTDRSTTDHIVQLKQYVKLGFNKGKSTTAVLLDITKAYDYTKSEGILFKLSRMEVTGQILKWIESFLTGRSVNVRIGDKYSTSRNIFKGVPQGAVISPLLFNVMMSDIPTPPDSIITLTYADDVLAACHAKNPGDAEAVLQPYLERLSKWGRKWGLQFSAEKSTCITFSRSHKTPVSPLLFLQGRRIVPTSSAKFLGLTFDRKLNWKDHINNVIEKYVKARPIFSIIAKRNYGPNLRTLSLLYKTLIRSISDYGLIVYGNASVSNLRPLEVISRSILRTILNAFKSTPTEILYAELGVEPLEFRKRWLAAKYTINLGFKTKNYTYATAYHLFHTPPVFSPRNRPALLKPIEELKSLEIKIFRYGPMYTLQSKPPPPWAPALHKSYWFPLSKDAASKNTHKAREVFERFVNTINPQALIAFTDGSVSRSPTSSSCAYWIPTTSSEFAGRLKNGTSIMSAELWGIYKTLEFTQHMDPAPPEVYIFTDSKSSMQALMAPPSSTMNPIITNIWRVMAGLKDAGTLTHLAWIPSHCGIPGNEKADLLAGSICNTTLHNQIDNDLTSSEWLSIYKETWINSILTELRKCKKEITSSKTNWGLVDWHHHQDRRISVSLHKLRSGHNRLNAFLARIDELHDPICRHNCVEPESVHHVLMVCPYYENERQLIKTFFQKYKITLDVPTLLGCNPSVPRHTQFEIRNKLVKFLTATGLISII